MKTELWEKSLKENFETLIDYLYDELGSYPSYKSFSVVIKDCFQVGILPGLQIRDAVQNGSLYSYLESLESNPFYNYFPLYDYLPEASPLLGVKGDKLIKRPGLKRKTCLYRHFIRSTKGIGFNPFEIVLILKIKGESISFVPLYFLWVSSYMECLNDPPHTLKLGDENLDVPIKSLMFKLFNIKGELENLDWKKKHVTIPAFTKEYKEAFGFLRTAMNSHFKESMLGIDFFKSVWDRSYMQDPKIHYNAIPTWQYYLQEK